MKIIKLLFIIILLFICVKKVFNQKLQINDDELEIKFINLARANLEPMINSYCECEYAFCFDINQLEFEVFYQLIPKDNISNYELNDELIDFVTIDTCRPGFIHVFKEDKYIGNFSIHNLLDVPVFNSNLWSEADTNTFIEHKRLIDTIKNINPDLILYTDLYFYTYGYLLKDKLYFYDINRKVFMSDDEFIKKNNLINDMKEWYKKYTFPSRCKIKKWNPSQTKHNLK